MNALTLDRPAVPLGRERQDQRRSRGPGQFAQPLPATLRWTQMLPREVQPCVLLRQFPRVANSLARTWSDPRASAKLLDDLVTDRRGHRQGFPPAIQHELLRLQDFLENRFPGVMRRA